MPNLHAIARLAISRLLEFYRQPTAVFWVFGFPLLMLVVLGLTFTDRPPETLHVDFIEDADPELGGRLRQAFSQDIRIVLNAPVDDPLKRLRRVGSSLIINLKASLDAADTTGFELIFDPDRPDSIQARDIVAMHIARLGENSPPVNLIESRSSGGRYVDFLVPGLLAVNAMGASLVWFGYGLSELRMLRLLRVMLTTPLTTTELVLGLLVSRWMLLIPETLLVLLVSYGLFEVSITGSILALLVVQLFGSAAFAAIGLLVGSRGNRLEGASGWLSVLMLGQWIFCGVFFSRSVFPAPWQPLIRWLPLSAYVDAARAVMLDGAGLVDLITPLIALSCWTLLCGLIGLWIFRVD